MDRDPVDGPDSPCDDILAGFVLGAYGRLDGRLTRVNNVHGSYVKARRGFYDR